MSKEENQSFNEAVEISWKRLALVVGCATALLALLILVSCAPIGATYRWLVAGASMLFAFAFLAVFSLYLARLVVREAVSATERHGKEMKEGISELVAKVSELEVETAAIKASVDLFGEQTKGSVGVVSERLVQIRQAIDDTKDRRR